MASSPIANQIMDQLQKLTPDQQAQVLEYTASLVRPRGEPGVDIIRRAHELEFPVEDLAEIQRAIDEDCETINPDDWDLPA